ncbi:serine/threonine-protein kinase PITSLRE [Diorhabda sublineata]|uniref:serine/threonine-protein kinase PITSLRE n=1 Tax=Diorhabda sublineata TaxID=1163346 RepID=UPI0024E05B60|nr:serine/threonine-protein kinase PITSLRE [Diorhabda sublineata]
MSENESVDEQSEDGELRQSPIDLKQAQEQETVDFSLSEEEESEVVDSLDIKPPQAKIAPQSRVKKREHERRKRSDRHRDDRHSHREKHREKSSRSVKDRDQYQRDKDRYYREKQHFEQNNYETQYRDRKEDKSRSRHSDSRKHDDKKSNKETRFRETEKMNYDEAKKGRGDKTLNDLRERLLSKRSNKVDNEVHARQKSSHRDKKHKSRNIDPLQGEAGLLVKEIINITTEEKKQKKEERMTEEERAEQEQRKQKFLEAEREMARLKEQSKMERERRHLEKASKRKHEEDAYGKRVKIEDAPVVVSDSSDVEQEESYQQNSHESEHSNNYEQSPSVHSEPSRASSQSKGDDSPYSDQRSATRSRSRSRSRSNSPSRSYSDRSRSQSPKSDDNDEDMEMDMKEKDEKPSDKPKSKVDESLPPYYPAVQGCRSVEEFQCLNRIEEGTYGVVYRARDKRTEDIVALKRLKMEKEKEGFPITSLREINTLLKGQHANIVTVREIVVGSNMDKIFIVMDYVEHDLKSLMETMRHKKQHFMPGEIKCLLKQLLLAVGHLHDNWILHRDLKTSNLLLSHKGILKVGDFGLAREYGSPLKPYTPIVVTMWYRAPELLLCTKEYSTPIDLWSVGCIFAELLLMNAVFPGKSEVDQLNRIFKDLGTPNEKIWPGFNQLPAVKKMKFNEYPVSNLRAKFNTLSEVGLGLLVKFLTYDPNQRITAEEGLKHAYFNEPPLPIDPSMFPTWPAKSELGHKRALAASPKPPSGGGEYKKLGRDVDDGYGFRLGMGIDSGRGGPGFSLKF